MHSLDGLEQNPILYHSRGRRNKLCIRSRLRSERTNNLLTRAKVCSLYVPKAAMENLSVRSPGTRPELGGGGHLAAFGLAYRSKDDAEMFIKRRGPGVRHADSVAIGRRTGNFDAKGLK